MPGARSGPFILSDTEGLQRDLDELLSLRAQSLEPPPRRQQAASFAQVIDAWLEAGCPIASPTNTSRHAREKSPNTIANARYLLDGHVRSEVGRLWVDRTAPARLEDLFVGMASTYSTSTVDRTWLDLNQAGASREGGWRPGYPRRSRWAACGCR